MKKKHLMGMLATGAAALLLSTVPAGCTDEREENPATGGRIGFSIDLWTEGSAVQAAQTKGAGTETGGLPADTLPAVSVIALEGGASGDGKPLYLHVVTTDGIGEDATAQNGGARTKAARVDNATMYEEMSVTAFVYPASDSWPSAYTGGTPSAASYMRTVRVKKSESWNTSYYWPGASRRISFFASAPYGSPGLTAFNDGASGNPPYLSYTVPAGVADQKDLLVASSTDRPGNTNAAEALAMKHALTAVRFVTGDDMLAGTVSKITLKDVYGTGKLPLQASAAWYDLGGTTSFAQTFSPEVVAPDPQAPGTPLTPETATFMMLPQTLPTNAQIEVIYTDNLTGTQRMLTADIAGKTWPMGKTVTYRISTSSIVVTPTLTVTQPADFDYQGGTKNYTVTSYATVAREGVSQTIPVAWTTEYSTDNGVSWHSNKPEWLTAFTESGTGSGSAEPCTATVKPQTGITNHPQNEALKAAQPVNDGVNSVYDLSTKGGTESRNTANCYIVNAPGKYCLPLVYGNGIKNGTTNPSAYNTSNSGQNILSRFVNHLGNSISNPYIYSNKDCTPTGCGIIWQDEPNLLKYASLSGDKKYLEFVVDAENIRQGNAVVTVYSNGAIMWSWHIWVTNYVPGDGDKTITNKQGNQYTIMPVNLGWCDGQRTDYAERTVQVRFKQTGTSAAPQIITVKQNPHSISVPGNNTFYQWGRKDPFVGVLDGNISKPRYNGQGNLLSSQMQTGNWTNGTAIVQGIKDPSRFCSYSYMDNKYYNLWNTRNTTWGVNGNTVEKTVYDPCPVGYKMPPSNAFTGFTTTGGTTQNLSQANVSGGFDAGWNFFCNPQKTDTVFFPASGNRSVTDANPSNAGAYGYYWTAGTGQVAQNVILRYYLRFYSSEIRPTASTQGGYGFSVRPSKE